MSPSVISLIGILLGMVILVFLAFKGYNVIIVSVIAALVVAVFAGTDILPLITDSYMTKFADFAKNNFMIFLLSAVFGKLMGDSGAADTIAYSMLRVVNHVHSQRTKQLVGGLMITAIVAVLTYGGVSLFVVIFALISIGRKLFEELDIPWRHYLTFHGIGSATFTMTMLPGTAALQNIIPTQYLGTTPMAGAAIGLTGAAIQILLCVLWAAFILKRARARGEGVARQFFCETRTEFLRKNSPFLRTKSETRSLASKATKTYRLLMQSSGEFNTPGGAVNPLLPLLFLPLLHAILGALFLGRQILGNRDDIHFRELLDVTLSVFHENGVDRDHILLNFHLFCPPSSFATLFSRAAFCSARLAISS